jgi:hypothetical protein
MLIQVEPDYEEMIDRVGQRLVAQKTIHQENPAVLVQRLRHPDGEGDADDEITEVSPNDRCHIFLLSRAGCFLSLVVSGITETWF